MNKSALPGDVEQGTKNAERAFQAASRDFAGALMREAGARVDALVSELDAVPDRVDRGGVLEVWRGKLNAAADLLALRAYGLDTDLLGREQRKRSEEAAQRIAQANVHAMPATRLMLGSIDVRRLREDLKTCADVLRGDRPTEPFAVRLE